MSTHRVCSTAIVITAAAVLAGCAAFGPRAPENAAARPDYDAQLASCKEELTNNPDRAPKKALRDTGTGAVLGSLLGVVLGGGRGGAGPGALLGMMKGGSTGALSDARGEGAALTECMKARGY